jgi:G:T/U-mismatch repair DNA glycosylase
VYFNGEKAERLYNRYVLTMIDPGRPVRFVRLPSTSPANTAAFKAKLEKWKAIGS